MDFSSIFGGLMGGGSAGANKQFGSSTAETVFGNYSRGRDGGLTPEWVPFALIGAVLLVVVLIIPKRR